MTDPTGSDKAECEIEITPEMIERAADALIWLDTSDGNPVGITRVILAAMGAEERDRGFVFRKRSAAADRL